MFIPVLCSEQHMKTKKFSAGVGVCYKMSRRAMQGREILPHVSMTYHQIRVGRNSQGLATSMQSGRDYECGSGLQST